MRQRHRIPLTNFISRALASRGWSDGDLASRTGLGRSRINRIKNRRAEPSVGEALLIARALDVHLRELFVSES